MSASNSVSFATVAAAFEQLEQTSSRKQLTAILANLLREVDADAIAEVAYLLQGRVAPLYEPVEFGVAQRTMEKAVSEVYQLDAAEVRRRDAAAGDLGLVVAELAAAAPQRASPAVHDVFNKLRSLAAISGAGSAERKLAVVREL